MTGVPDVPDAPGAPDVDALTAALRADSSDLEIYSRVLSTSLSEAFPAGMVQVERDRSLGDRLAGRPGKVRTLRIDAGDTSLVLETGRGGVPVARVATAVRGVVISTKQVELSEWVRVLAEQLTQRARESAAARATIARMLGG